MTSPNARDGRATSTVARTVARPSRPHQPPLTRAHAAAATVATVATVASAPLTVDPTTRQPEHYAA